MGWYAEHILPRLDASGLDRPDVAELRHQVCSTLTGEVVEIGFGSGLNVSHYPGGVRRVHAVEPSRLARKLAEPRLSTTAVPVIFDADDAQRLPFDDASMDCALVTFVLCTVGDPALAAAELHRVLVPGGTVAFVEHGRSPDPSVQRWQRRLNGVNRRLCGCPLDRVAPDILAGAGFAVTVSAERYLDRVPRFAGYLYQGTARKAA
jgi:SAM-dependent methyltransferase